MELTGTWRAAVAEHRLAVEYQPIVDLGSGEVVAVEALVRWTHVERGPVRLSDLLPVAESSGLIHDLGLQVLEEAARAATGWQRHLPDGRRLDLSVNLSPVQLTAPDFVERVREVLARTGLPPGSLVLELTNSRTVTDETAVARLQALRLLGIRIALDDFGTGYSALDDLARLPVDILKLHRCYVADLHGGPDRRALVEAVLLLARIMRLDLVAKGVEQSGEALEVARLGYATGQGFHFAHPLSPAAVTELVQAGSPWPAVPVQTVPLTRTNQSDPALR